MPNIPGVTNAAERGELENPVTNWKRAAIAVGALLILGSFGAWIMMRTSHHETEAVVVPVLEPSPAVEDLPARSASRAPINNDIGTVEQLATPWSAKKFTFTRALNGEQFPAIAIRLPGTNGHTAASYWVILLKSPFGNCLLEYLSDPKEITSRFGYSANHPMVADACSNTLYDPRAWALCQTVPGRVAKSCKAQATARLYKLKSNWTAIN